jgi:hypothetical protein
MARLLKHFYPKQPWDEMGNGLLTSADLYASECKNHCFYQNCQIQKKRGVPFIIQVIIHVLMNSLFAIAAELP